MIAEPIPSSDRSLTPLLLRGAAWLFGVLAALSFWVGGRALHEFAKLDRMIGEMGGFALTALFAVFAVVLRGIAERVETHDDGKPITLAIGGAGENEKTN
jgi:hypothetical protein